MCWVYIESEPGLYTVGYFEPSGQWRGDSDWDTREAARERVHFLNGGSSDLFIGKTDPGRGS
jgi:hypothetical protein